MCRGYSQSSLVGAKTATLLLPAHLESRLSGSAERLTPSLLSSPHPHHPSIHPSFCLSCCVSTPPTFIHYLCSCRGSIEILDQLSLFPLSHSLSFTLVSLFLLSLLLDQPPTHLMKDKIVRKKMSARHGAHVEDIIETIVIPLPLKVKA